ncbi:MAG: hypothetical protein JWM12_3707 [Ilumatobacteraceae bacterium]|jgi:hypothetical protein|nr:hypothetical protein [Ilumatobacteraceae bacterium]
MPVTTAHRPSSGLPRLRDAPEWLAVVVIGVVVLLAAVMLRGGDHIDHISLMNPSTYQVEVFASTPNDATLLPIAIIDPGKTHDAREIVDLGDRWILHFRAGGVEVQPVEVDRAQLLGDTFDLPTDLDQQFRALGLPPAGG